LWPVLYIAEPVSPDLSGRWHDIYLLSEHWNKASRLIFEMKVSGLAAGLGFYLRRRGPVAVTYTQPCSQEKSSGNWRWEDSVPGFIPHLPYLCPSRFSRSGQAPWSVLPQFGEGDFSAFCQQVGKEGMRR
jgi:hypothetical protein